MLHCKIILIVLKEEEQSKEIMGVEENKIIIANTSCIF